MGALFVAAVGGLLGVFLVERVLHAFCTLAWHILHGTESDLRTYAAFGVLATMVQAFWNGLFAVGALTVTAGGALASASAWLVRLVLIGMLCAALFEFFPRLVEDFIVYWNLGFGTGLRAVLFQPAFWVYQLASVVSPVTNAIFYVLLKTLTVVIIPGLEFDPDAALSFLSEFLEVFKHTFESLSAYLQTFRSCEEGGVVDTSCFELGLRMLDLITPLSHARLMVGHAVAIFAVNCRLLAAPVDLALYPFMDINFAKAAHNIVNAPLLGLLHVPAVTLERCRLSPGGPLAAVMCTPDFEPVWKTFSSGMRFLGRGLDNWLNIAALIVQESVTGEAPSCQAPPVQQDVSAPDTTLFGTAETIVVGLTPGLYAVTDGWHTEYTVFWTAVQRMVVGRSWPLAVDVGLGVAAVQYTDADEMDDSGYATTAMLGCACRDVVDADSPTGGRMSITCAISPYAAEAYDTIHLRVDDYVLPVEFQQPSAAYDLRCAQATISVQSVRWPLSRLSDSVDDPSDPPRELDAALYVVPACGFSGPSSEPDLACIDSFTRAGCFPYCLAGRPRGSMNSALILFDADDWEGHVQLLQRDCGLGSIEVSEDFGDNGYEFVRGAVPANYSSRFDVRWSDVPGTTITTRPVAGDISSGACRYDRQVSSRVDRLDLPTYDDLQSVRLGGQPFVVAGDAALFVEWKNLEDVDPDNDVPVIRVRRLFGSEAGQFTQWTLPAEIPTLGGCQTAAECGPLPPGVVTLPWAYSRSPGDSAPAVATKRSVLYAVNPSPDIYASFFNWCAGGVNVGTQFQVTSAYGPIRVWRVDAFLEGASLAAQVAADDALLSLEAFDGQVSWDSCSNPRNLSVTSLTYINEHNVAVTVLRASPRYYDVETRAPRADAPAGGGEVSFDVYYLNPRTMRLQRHELWQEEVPVSTLAQGYLCAAVRRVPPLGGLMVESMLAGSALLRFPASVLVNIPALRGEELRQIRQCPVVTRGHTILRECGAHILSLEYLWEAVLRGNTYFWMSFSDLGAILGGGSPSELARTMLNGVAWSGAHGFNVVPLGFLSPMRKLVVNRMPQVARPFFVAVGSGIGFTRFLYEFVQTLILDFLELDYYSHGVGGVVDTVWGTAYAMRWRYDEIVTAPGLQTCTGVGLLLGWGNPFARLARDSCIGQTMALPAALRLGTVFFVHYPVLKCMCQMPGGVVLQERAARECLSRAPLAFRPVIAEVIRRGADQFRGMCVEMVGVADDALLHAPDALFSVAFDVAADVQDALDYLVAAVDGTGASCTDFYSNPYVMVLMPYPLDYFRSCGETETCRLRCADLFAAFEASKARSETGRSKTVQETMLVERPFLTEDDILNRRHLQPFQVLGMIEHTSCDCGGRCFSVAGVDAAEQLAVALYCVPRTAGVGMREVSRWAVEGSAAWTALLLDVKFLHLRQADGLLAVRADGLFLCSSAGSLRRVVGILGDETFYSWSPDAMHSIEHIYVLPGRAEEEDGTVIVHGTVRHRSFESGSILERLCVTVRVDLETLSPLQGVFFYPTCEAEQNLDEVAGDSEIVISADAEHAVLVPTSLSGQVQYCLVDRLQARLHTCLSLGEQNGLLYSAATLLSSFRSSVGEMFTLSREGVTMRREEVVSQSSVERYAAIPEGEVVTFFKTAHASSSAAWLSDVRMAVGAESLTSLEERRSSSAEVTLAIERDCSVMSCSGCVALGTQKLCYAAQQCALSRCVGSTVHLQRPACMWGILLKDSIESVIAVASALWITFVEVTGLVVDTSTGTLGTRVEVNFPYDAVDTVVCDGKDVIVTFFGSIMSVVNSAAVALTDVSSSGAAGGVNEVAVFSTYFSATLTNVFAHVTYGLLYVHFAWYQTLACSTNSMLAILDVSGGSIRVRPSGGEEGWDAIGGQCVTKLAEESLTEFGAGGGARQTVLGVLDDMTETLMRIASSMPLESLIHNLDAGVTWAIGVVKTFQDLMQAIDLDGCRVPDLSLKLVGTCACGDSAAMIPPATAQKGLFDSAFWCTGTLRMTLADGSSKVVFNPHTFADLRQMAAPSLEAYLDCVSGGFEDGRYASCFELEPRDQLGMLEAQGVTLLAVMARCRGNYANLQWDDGAGYLFNSSLSEDLSQMRPTMDARFPAGVYAYEEVAACLRDSLILASGTDVCLNLLLRILDVRRSEYFAYEEAADGVQTDACEVFTGPARDGIAPFRQCLDENQGVVDTALGGTLHAESDCELPYFLWTGSSRNRIPVASAHFKVTTGENGERFTVADNQIESAQIRVLQALDAFLAEETGWQAAGLEVSLFTSEGDSLHQALDCMILGPYAAVDLWPGDESLPSVRYSRQRDGDPSREFQLPCTGDSLEGDHALPFTCGSPARRALMKYFLRDHFTAANETLASIVRERTLDFFRDLRDVWQDRTNFGCPCPEEGGRDIRCCSEEDTAGWTAFLGGTARQKEIQGSELTADLLGDLQAFLETEFVTNTHEVLTRHAGEAEDYVWTAEEALLATDLGLYHLQDPVVFYDEGEAAEPFKGNSSLFDLCVSHLSSVIFTLPLSRGEWAATGTAYDPAAGSSSSSFLSALEEYVSSVLEQARLKSPLHWQHVLRHVPSDSQMCLDVLSPHSGETPSTMPLRSLEEDEELAHERFATVRNNLAGMFADMAEKGGTPEDVVGEAPPRDMFSFVGAYYNSFAAMDERCVCDWGDERGCFLPELLCEFVVARTETAFERLRQSCAEAVGGRVYYAVELDLWQAQRAVAGAGAELTCGDMAPSDAWGVLDARFAEAWIEGGVFEPAVAMREVLTLGRSGVRAGNLLQLRARWHSLVSPSGRHKPLVHASYVGSTAAQKWCLSSFAGRVSRESLLERYVDELFPVAQGVRGSMGAEACTRYVLELARLRLVLAAGLSESGSLRQTVETWRKRCRAQLNTVAMCNVRGVYDVVPQEKSSHGCPFWVKNMQRKNYVYITESCLVYLRGKFYDPCLCEDCSGPAKRLTDSTVAKCPLPIDVRRLATHPTFGGGFHWPQEFPAGADQTALRQAISDLVAFNENSARPMSLEPGYLFESVFDSPAPGAFNTLEAWPTAEGPSAQTGSALHCDSVLDWWPEAWDEPVGYHVTTPPFADEAGYRVFDNAFAIDRGGGDFSLVRVVYEHDYLRNETLSRNHFGASGLCGTHSYGMEMREVNSERVCTRTSRHDMADPAVPLRSFATDEELQDEFFPPACAETYEVPWEVRETTDFDAAAWAGLVGHWADLGNANWPPLYAEPVELPETMARRGREGTVEEVMSGSCFLPRQTVCETDADCRSLALLADARPLACIGKVCAVAAQGGGVFECASHADCGGGLLCSGLGVCVPGVLQFSNHLDEEVEAQVFSSECSAGAESMVGASPWDVIENLLPDSGFCSYRAWFEQRDLLERAGCSAEGACGLDSRTASIRHSGISGGVHRGTLWEEGRLQVAAHVCDRDYMHVADMAACTPPEGVCLDADGAPCDFRHSRVTRTYQGDGTLPLHFSPVYHDAAHGFLGLNEEFDALYDRDAEQSRLVFCSDIPQCHLPVFTMNGFRLRQRPVINTDALVARDPSLARPYGEIGLVDYFRCGAFGALVEERDGAHFCVLDPAVTALYYTACRAGISEQLGQKCPWSFVGGVHERLCVVQAAPSLPFYDGTPEVIQALASHLNWMLTEALETGFETFARYRKLSSCATLLWETFHSFSEVSEPVADVWEDEEADTRRQVRPEWLYYFDSQFPHTATEFPFAWWVKCTLLSGVRPASNAIVACPAWERRLSDLGEAGGETVASVLRRLDGHVTEEWWSEKINQGASSVDENTCLPAGGVTPTENEERLIQMFHLARESLLQPGGLYLEESLAETCFSRKEFDVDTWKADRNWMLALLRFYTFGDESAIPEEYVFSTGRRTVEHEATGHRIWRELCSHWFAGEDWFEEDDGVLDNLFTAGGGIPVGHFPHFARNHFEALQDVTAAGAVPEQCLVNIDPGEEEGAFCIFALDPFQDPLISQAFQMDSDPAAPLVLLRTDDDPANTMQFFDHSGGLAGEKDDIFFADLCRQQPPPLGPEFSPLLEPQDSDAGGRRLLSTFDAPVTVGDLLLEVFVSMELQNRVDSGAISEECRTLLFKAWLAGDLPGRESGSVFDHLTQEQCLSLQALVDDGPDYADVLRDRGRDASGQSCSLLLDSADDTCDADWLTQYSLLTGDEFLRCSADGEFRFHESAPPEAADMVRNPARDVCWSKDSTCLFSRLASAGRLRFPPGVTYWLYRDPTEELSPTEEHLEWRTFLDADEETELVHAPTVPAWQFCPAPDIPKSYDWPLVSKAWGKRDYSEATLFSTNEGAPFSQEDVLVELRVPLWSLRLRLRDDSACCREGCEDVCANLGLPARVPMEVRRGLFHCTPCTAGDRVFCAGRHGCRHAPLQWIDESQAAFLRENGIPFDEPMTYTSLARAAHLLAKHHLLAAAGFDGTMRVTPQTPPYYQSTNVDAFAYFDSTGARDYIDSLTTGDGRSLTECAVTDARASVSYEQCGTDEYLLQFADFVRANYWHDAFVRVPPGGTAAWEVDAAQLLTSSVLAYAAHERPLREKFVEWLLDFDRHCEAGSLYNSICFRETESHFRLLNPWVGGDFNPVDFCDTPLEPSDNQRIIDVFCNKLTCPAYYEGAKQDDLFYQAIPDFCDRARGGAPSRILPLSADPSNLCSKAPVSELFCHHRQASLGGVVDQSGAAVDGAAIAGLYEEVSRDRLESVGGLLAPPRNKLFEGKLKQEAAYSGIPPVRLAGEDIGGTHVHLAVGADGALRVHDILLATPPDSGDHVRDSISGRDPDMRWLEAFEELMAVEGGRARERMGGEAEEQLDWDCPFLRLHYWGGAEREFSPPLPGGARAQVMFAGLSGNQPVHPLQSTERAETNEARLSTANGRCFCVDPVHCSTSVENTDTCGLLQQIQSTYDERWRQASSAGGVGQGLCFDQLDWPYAGGTLRDGSALPGARFQRNCSVLERLPPFQFRFENVPFRGASATPTTTSAEGGDCHMARGTRRAASEDVRCRLRGKNDTHTVLLCEDGTAPVLERERSRAPEWVVSHAHRARRRCADADAPPQFVSRSGAPIPAASSFGVHARISAERFLASDLHRLLCGALDCPAELAAESWETGVFLQTLLSDPAALLQGAEGEAPRDLLLGATPPDDDVLWREPWVTCVRDEGSGEISECRGTIAKEDWLDPARRGERCAAAVREDGDNKLSLNLSLCDLDGRTAALCEILANAENDVQTAHCVASGACLQETFFYHPATYSVTNEQFVRDTVEDFYLGVDPGACDEAAAESAALLRGVRDNREDCSALWLDGVVVLLQQMRAILHSLVRMTYYLFMTALNVLRLLAPVDFFDVLSDVLYYFTQLFEEAGDVIKALAEIVWRSILEAPLGKSFREVVESACDVIVVILDFMKKVVCGLLYVLFEALHRIFRALDEFSITGWRPFDSAISQGFLDALGDAVRRFEQCLGETLTCDIARAPASAETLSLPAATRCWSQYVTSFGDASSLSCTAADTCVQGISEDLIICDACPATPPGVNDFGCDPIRKVCACGVPQRERTPCVNHLQCRVQPDATCSFVDDDVEATFGTIGCAECSHEPLCVRTSAGETGHCACTLSLLEEESCDEAAVGQNVFPNGRGLCLAATGSAATALSRDTNFLVEHDSLLAIPCSAADITQTFCFDVQYSAFTTLQRIVSLDILETGAASGPFRRLLGAGPEAATRLLDAPWEDASGVCAELVALWAGGDGLRPLERERLLGCLKWRRVAQDAIRRHNLSRVDDRFLLSLRDFAAEVQRFDALVDLVTHPRWALDALLHSDAAQPLVAALSLFQRWSASRGNESHSPWAHFLFALYRDDINYDIPSLDWGVNQSVFRETSSPSFRETSSPSSHVRRMLADAPLRNQPLTVDRDSTERLRRHLLEWRSQLSAVSEYSLAVTLSGEATQPLPDELAGEWVTGPFRWPPDYSYWRDGTTDCVAGGLFQGIVRQAFSAVVLSYRGDGPRPATPVSSFAESALRIPLLEEVPAKDEFDRSRGDAVISATYWVRDQLAWFGLDDLWFYSLFAAIPETVDKFFTCDLEKVMFCTHYKHTIWNSTWWMLIYSSLALFLLQFARVPFRRLVLFSIFTPLVLFYSLEYSVLCTPMVPPCVLDESIQILDSLIPTTLHPPNALLSYPGCLEDANRTGPCLLSCADEPHGYTRWEAPVAWWLCDYDRPVCLRVRDWLRGQAVSFSDTFQRYLTQKAQIIATGDPDLVTAQRVCATLTAWYAAPWLLVATVVLYAGTWSILVLFVALQSGVSLSLQTYQLSHITTRRPGRNIFIQRALRERVS